MGGVWVRFYAKGADFPSAVLARICGVIGVPCRWHGALGLGIRETGAGGGPLLVAMTPAGRPEAVPGRSGGYCSLCEGEGWGGPVLTHPFGSRLPPGPRPWPSLPEGRGPASRIHGAACDGVGLNLVAGQAACQAPRSCGGVYASSSLRASSASSSRTRASAASLPSSACAWACSAASLPSRSRSKVGIS